jgi:cold shock CspA family protein
MQYHEGKIIKFTDRGYGFIGLDDGRNVFFHIADLTGELRTTEELLHRLVVCQVGNRERGLFAFDIRAAAVQ